MAITTDDEHRRTNDAVVGVRVPNGADDDLATAAARRLSRAEGVAAVTVDGLRGVDPGLSATTVTLAVTLTVADGRDPSAVRRALRDLTAVECVEPLQADER